MREMKDSGISWVGEIPKEWSVNRAKYCFVNTKEIAGCMSDRYERLYYFILGKAVMRVK